MAKSWIEAGNELRAELPERIALAYALMECLERCLEGSDTATALRRCTMDAMANAKTWKPFDDLPSDGFSAYRSPERIALDLADELLPYWPDGARLLKKAALELQERIDDTGPY